MSINWPNFFTNNHTKKILFSALCFEALKNFVSIMIVLFVFFFVAKKLKLTLVEHLFNTKTNPTYTFNTNKKKIHFFPGPGMSTWGYHQPHGPNRISQLKSNYIISPQIRYQQKPSRSVDKKPGVFKCPKCGKHYRWLRNMKNHLKIECGKEPKECCPYCPHRTKYKSSLQKHIIRIHFS